MLQHPPPPPLDRIDLATLTDVLVLIFIKFFRENAIKKGLLQNVDCFVQAPMY